MNRRYWFYAVLLIFALLLSTSAAAEERSAASMAEPKNTAKACIPSPLGKRELFLRGSFNTWGVKDAQRFSYRCNRYELITDIQGRRKT